MCQPTGKGEGPAEPGEEWAQCYGQKPGVLSGRCEAQVAGDEERGGVWKEKGQRLCRGFGAGFVHRVAVDIIIIVWVDDGGGRGGRWI